MLASTGTATSNLGYAGQYTDPTTGLIYDQARWYDPATGQFMIIDPKLESTWLAYAYAGDDPLINVDPTGDTLTFKQCFAIGLAIAKCAFATGIVR